MRVIEAPDRLRQPPGKRRDLTARGGASRRLATRRSRNQPEADRQQRSGRTGTQPSHGNAHSPTPPTIRLFSALPPEAYLAVQPAAPASSGARGAAPPQRTASVAR